MQFWGVRREKLHSNFINSAFQRSILPTLFAFLFKKKWELFDVREFIVIHTISFNGEWDIFMFLPHSQLKPEWMFEHITPRCWIQNANQLKCPSAISAVMMLHQAVGFHRCLTIVLGCFDLGLLLAKLLLCCELQKIHLNVLSLLLLHWTNNFHEIQNRTEERKWKSGRREGSPLQAIYLIYYIYNDTSCTIQS